MFTLTMGAAAQAADEPRYQAWQGNDAATAALVERLNGLIDGAERVRAADPNFLADLRAAIDGAGSFAQQAPEPVEIVSSARASSDPPRAVAAPEDSGGSLLSTITDSLDSLTGGGGLLSGLTGGSEGGSGGGGALSNADIGAGLRQPSNSPPSMWWRNWAQWTALIWIRSFTSRCPKA